MLAQFCAMLLFLWTPVTARILALVLQLYERNKLKLELKHGARFTKYLTTILRLSYDNAKVTIDLRQTSHSQNILRKTQDFSLATIRLQNRKIV